MASALSTASAAKSNTRSTAIEASAAPLLAALPRPTRPARSSSPLWATTRLAAPPAQTARCTSRAGTGATGRSSSAQRQAFRAM